MNEGVAPSASPNALAAASQLIAEIYSVYGSLRTLIVRSNADLQLAPLEVLTLGAVIEQPEPLTVAQIGKISGYSRQAIQRAATALEAQGLIQMVANPRHKRSALLVPTEEGRRVKEASERARLVLARHLAGEHEADSLQALLRGLQAVKLSVDAHASDVLTELSA